MLLLYSCFLFLAAMPTAVPAAADKSDTSKFAVEVSMGTKILAIRNIPSNPYSSLTLVWSTIIPPVHLGSGGRPGTRVRAKCVNTLRTLERPGATPAAVAFELSFQTEGDGVQLQQAIDCKRASPVRTVTENAYTVRERIDTISRSLGSGLLRLNERKELTEMAQADLIPLAVRVIPARKSGAGLFPIFSQAPSVQVLIREQVEYPGTPHYYFRLLARNLSPLSLLIGDVRISCNDSDSGTFIWGEVPPGAFAAFGGYSGYCQVRDPRIFLHLYSAVFEDGKYEGDVQFLASAAGRPLAAMLLLRRFRQAADPILADPKADDAAKLIQLRAAAERLPDEPDRQLLADVHRLMRGMPNALPRDVIDADAAGGVHMQKRFILDALSEYQPGVASPLAEWWRERQKTVGVSTEMQARATGR